ncbi:MAG TPA: GNAT family N-acetyltransferase, partial [Clostridia bacterium]|nr:GNAT family N-acetyltransferase [Clostridia bacterium]
MKLYTENLILTTLKPKDADKVLSFVLRNRERLTPVEPKRQPDYYSLKGQMRLLSYDTQAMRKGTSFRLWVVPKSNPDIIIGSVSAYRIVGGNISSCMIGYRIDKDYEGMGYMSEALKESIDYIFNTLGLNRIEAAILPGNE